MFAHGSLGAVGGSWLEVMHHACAVPLNPNFTEAELLLALEQLKCSVLVTAQGHAAQAAGRELGLRILLLKATRKSFRERCVWPGRPGWGNDTAGG